MKMAGVIGSLVAALGWAPADATAQGGNAADAVEIRLWFVSFSPELDAQALPLDLSQLAEMPGFPHGQQADGRIRTTGLASQATCADFRVEADGCTLAFRDGQLVSSGDGAPWKIMTTPRLVTRRGERASLSVGTAVRYLEPRDDGCLVLEETADAVEGVTMGLTYAHAADGGLRFTDIDLKVSRVVERAAVPGIPFDVGRPVMDTRSTQLNVTLDDGKVAAIPLPQRPDEAPIFVFMTAHLTEAP